MIDNPFQSPKAELTETAPTEHRSFRLTRISESADDNVVVGTFGDAISFALVQQLPLLLLSALLLDGGLVFKRVVIASVAFWILTLIILIHRGRNMLDSDTLMIKWGYLPILLATCILWAIGSALTF